MRLKSVKTNSSYDGVWIKLGMVECEWAMEDFFYQMTFEDLWVSIQASKFESIIAGAVYKHPNTNPDCIAYLERMLQTYIVIAEKICIC